VLSSLQARVSDIEQQLDVLEHALASSDLPAIEQASQQLQQRLSEAVAAVRQARQQGQPGLDEGLRQRLVLAQTRVQQQWAQAHRASASVERVLNILLPQEDTVTYGNPVATRALSAYR
jgi:chromosome segregation ATPase